ncbi:MAG: hypothetical protein QM756_02875 [Polyangiaceae bacterium]
MALIVVASWLAGIAWAIWAKRVGLAAWQRALTAFVPALLVRVLLSMPVVFLLEDPGYPRMLDAATILPRACRMSAAGLVAGALAGVSTALLFERRGRKVQLAPPSASLLGLGVLTLSAWLALGALNCAGYEHFLKSLAGARCGVFWELELPCDSGWLPMRERHEVLMRLWHVDDPGSLTPEPLRSAWSYHPFNQAMWWGGRATLLLAVGVLVGRCWMRIERRLARALQVSVLLLGSLTLYCVASGRADTLRDARAAGAAGGFVALSMLGGCVACGVGSAVLATRREVTLVLRSTWLVAAMACGVVARFAFEHSAQEWVFSGAYKGVNTSLQRLGAERALLTLALLSLVVVVAQSELRGGALHRLSWWRAAPLVLAQVFGGLVCLRSLPYASDAHLNVGLNVSPRKAVVDVCKLPWRHGSYIVGDAYTPLSLNRPASWWSGGAKRVEDLALNLRERIQRPDYSNHPELPYIEGMRVIGLAAQPTLQITDVQGVLQGMLSARDPMLVLVVGQSVSSVHSVTVPGLLQAEHDCVIGAVLLTREAKPRNVSTLGELMASNEPFNPFP